MSNNFKVIADHFADKEGVETGRMFGAEGLKVAGKVFAMEVKGQLVVKLPAKRVSELVAMRSAKAFDPGHGKLMKEWIEVNAKSDLSWLAVAQESFTFVKATAKKK